MIDYQKLKEHYGITEDIYGEKITNVFCKHCDFTVWRREIVSWHGHHVKYGGMRSKVVKHIREAHPEIWQQVSLKLVV